MSIRQRYHRAATGRSCPAQKTVSRKFPPTAWIFLSPPTFQRQAEGGCPRSASPVARVMPELRKSPRATRKRLARAGRLFLGAFDCSFDFLFSRTVKTIPLGAIVIFQFILQFRQRISNHA